MTEQALNSDQARVALMVEILHTYRARNLARARGDLDAARRCHRHLTALLDQLVGTPAYRTPTTARERNQS